MGDGLKLIACCAGVFICYLCYGIYQEKVTRGTYGEDGEKFTFALSLVFIQCVANALFAKSALLFKSKPLSPVPSHLFILTSLSYIVAMVASNKSLQYVAYPTQVLVKSCKPISVMLLGVLLARKRYSLLKYVCVFLIVAGVATFLYPDKTRPPKDVTNERLGDILLFGSLLFDGVTGALQERTKEYNVGPHQMMLNVNFYSLFYLLGALIFTGESFQFLAFVQRYPQVMWDIFLFSALSALGQNFIFVTVTTFGTLTCSLVTTTRKFLTIFCSVLLFGNQLLSRQWIGVALVFGGLFLEGALKQRNGNSKEKQS